MSAYVNAEFGKIVVSWVCEPGSALIRLTHAATGEKLIEFPLTSVMLWDIYAGTIEEPVPVPMLGLEDEIPLPEPDVLSLDDLDGPPPPKYAG